MNELIWTGKYFKHSYLNTEQFLSSSEYNIKQDIVLYDQQIRHLIAKWASFYNHANLSPSIVIPLQSSTKTDQQALDYPAIRYIRRYDDWALSTKLRLLKQSHQSNQKWVVKNGTEENFAIKGDYIYITQQMVVQTVDLYAGLRRMSEARGRRFLALLSIKQVLNGYVSFSRKY